VKDRLGVNNFPVDFYLPLPYHNSVFGAPVLEV